MGYFSKFSDLKITLIFKILFIIYFCFVLYFLVFIPLFLISSVEITGTDYLGYVTGARVIREGSGELIYDLSVQHNYQQRLVEPFTLVRLLPFRWLPFVGAVFLPFTFFSLYQGYKVFVVFNILIVGLIAFLSGKIFHNVRRFSLWFFFPFIYPAVVHTVIKGQLSIVLTLVLLMLYVWLQKKASFLSGVFCGLLLIKPQFIVAFPFYWLLAREKIRFTLGYLLTVLVLVVLSIYISGVSTILSYPEFVLATENLAYGSPKNLMFSLASFLAYFPFFSDVNFLFIILINSALFVIALGIFGNRIRYVSFCQSFIAGTLFFLVFAVHVLDHDLSLILVAFFILLDRVFREERGKLTPLYVLTMALFLIPGLFWVKLTVIGAPLLLSSALFLLFSERWIRNSRAKTSFPGLGRISVRFGIG